MKKITIYFFAAIICYSFFASCATRGPVVGKERIIQTSGKKGDWVSSEVSFFEKDKMLFFRGQVSKVNDLTMGLRQAEAEAKKRMVGKIAELVQAEFTTYAIGANMSEYDRGNFVADGIAWVSEKVQITGSVPFKSYWEKVEITKDYGIEYAYNVYTLLQIPKKDYNKARNRAINGLFEKAKEVKNKKAEEAALELKKKLEKGESD